MWKKEVGGVDPWLASLENEEDLEARIGEAALARKKRWVLFSVYTYDIDKHVWVCTQTNACGIDAFPLQSCSYVLSPDEPMAQPHNHREEAEAEVEEPPEEVDKEGIMARILRILQPGETVLKV